MNHLFTRKEEFEECFVEFITCYYLFIRGKCHVEEKEEETGTPQNLQYQTWLPPHFEPHFENFWT